MRTKLYLETFGCQMNVLDSELVMGQLCASGYEPVPNLADADVILYNTCSVREHAEQKVWSRLGELRPRKAADPGLIIGVIGCLAERDGVNLFKRHPHVDILCGPGELDKLPALVRNASATCGERSRTACGERSRTACGEHSRTACGEHSRTACGEHSRTTPRPRQTALMGRQGSRRSATLAAAEDTLEMLDLSRSISPADDTAQAYVRITRGCNKFCTYCVVPYTRGAEVHRPPQNVIDEVRRLADAGVREVTLLGQTINHYAFTHGDGRVTTFADLLYQVHEAVPHLPRLRFVTSFPRDFSNEALAAMRDCTRICRYLHAPAQHGSDRILRLMNRGYAAAQYMDFIDRARDYMPDVCIASDFIVGFPTETDEEFDQTADLLRRCRFKNSFIFKYSPRPGTTAMDRFEDDVPDAVKRRRNNDLLNVQQEISAAENARMIGRTVEVLVEGQSKLAARPAQAGSVELGWEKKSPACPQMIGRTRGDQVVVFDGPISLKGKLVDVEIVDAKSLTLFGKPTGAGHGI